jgi:ubiquinone/menaquinone biosynthesis C-methylase UbiE
MTDERVRLRATFDAIAKLYDRARPGYPPALLDDLARLAGVGPGCRVLEIGPGTGQLTVPLAARGCTVVAVELGAEMAAVAQRNLRRFPAVEVVNADFETWPLPDEQFDLVIGATAMHWIDPEVLAAKASAALHPGGKLATVETHHIEGGTLAYFIEVQDCYLRFDPATDAYFQMPTAADIPADDVAGRYEWDQTYSTAEYLDLVRTYSSTLGLPPSEATGLLTCIGSLIDRRYGGQITKHYLTQLVLTDRPNPPN